MTVKKKKKKKKKKKVNHFSKRSFQTKPRKIQKKKINKQSNKFLPVTNFFWEGSSKAIVVNQTSNFLSEKKKFDFEKKKMKNEQIGK